ncbi:F0F1 ATP synthase subunit B [Desulfoluna spongiiphila]|uniref:ATP synthase subunit b n=1 Tax=Desulfoluna spongiiphila TaxID=419481 RepID=A0A1G5IU12_9BACT|nr:F0F1 ATP synthase subunit B [Desulfoluna spongiiphila]SCY79526.1 F-type H+-transporting ATPase subunit b [Desulfoluna spongiiphila]VVS93372.1 atp synthase f0 complex subunit b/b' bacterial/chloroplast [Desulfoluna spongiiphila]
MRDVFKSSGGRRLLFWGLFVALTLTAGAAFASSGGGHAAEAKHWLTTDTARVLNFVVLMGFLFFVLRKPVSNALSGRISTIKDELDTLEKQKADAEKTLAEYETKIATLEDEVEVILGQYRDQGEAAKKRIMEEAELHAVKLEEQAKRNIDHEFKAARADLKAEIMALALSRAEALIQEKINTDDQEKLVDDYLNKVVV